MSTTVTAPVTAPVAAPSPKPNQLAVNKRREALERRKDLIAEFLANNAEVAEI